MVGKVPSKHYIALDFHKQKTHSILSEYVFEGLKPLSVEYSFSIKPALHIAPWPMTIILGVLAASGLEHPFSQVIRLTHAKC